MADDTSLTSILERYRAQGEFVIKDSGSGLCTYARKTMPSV